jgi:hypothetical protein
VQFENNKIKSHKIIFHKYDLQGVPAGETGVGAHILLHRGADGEEGQRAQVGVTI